MVGFIGVDFRGSPGGTFLQIYGTPNGWAIISSIVVRAYNRMNSAQCTAQVSVTEMLVYRAETVICSNNDAKVNCSLTYMLITLTPCIILVK